MAAPLPDPVPDAGPALGATTGTKRNPRVGLTVIAVLLGAGTLWGGFFTLANIATQRLPPLGITFWQLVFSVGLLAAVQVIRRKPLPLSRRHLAVYVVCGILGTALPTSLFFYAAAHIPAGIISITVATVPMLTFALAWMIQLEGFSIRRLAGIVLGALAIGLLVGPETSLPDPAAILWVLVAVVASSSFAFENIVLGRWMPPKTDAVTLLTGMQIAATIVFAPVALLSGQVEAALFLRFEAIQAAVPAMAAVNVVSYVAFVWLIANAGPVFASQIAYLVTLSGVLWGIAVLGESHSAWVWAALVVMMAGLALVQPREGGPGDGARTGL